LDREKKERAERNAQRKAENTGVDKLKLIEEKRAEISAAMDRIKNDKKLNND